MPVYNEKDTILEVLKRIERVELPSIEKEIVIVDDGSSDGTREILLRLQNQYKVIFQDKNYGKGLAVREGLKLASGEIILIQDADLEYDPRDYPKLLKPILARQANVVYGSRILGEKLDADKGRAGWIYYLGGRFLSFLTNLLYGTKITDEPTGYKVFKAEVIKNLALKCQRFEFCPEVTAKIAKKKIKIFEVPISYHPRHKKQGKKINFKDALVAIWTLIKYRFLKQ